MDRRSPGLSGDLDSARNPTRRHARLGSLTGSGGVGWLLPALLATGCLDVAGPDGSVEPPPDAQHLLVPATGQYLQISAAHNHTCAVRVDGVVNCWGRDELGEAPTTRSTAVGYTKVYTSDDNSCALRADGVVECFGFNTFGEAPPVVNPPAGTRTPTSPSGRESAAHCATMA